MGPWKYVLFDDPNCQAVSPKYFERLHRDKNNPISDDHNCTDFISDLHIPPNWRKDIISCRRCKRNLVCFLSKYFV